jgi:hypothetical protein
MSPSSVWNWQIGNQDTFSDCKNSIGHADANRICVLQIDPWRSWRLAIRQSKVKARLVFSN